MDTSASSTHTNDYLKYHCSASSLYIELKVVNGKHLGYCLILYDYYTSIRFKVHRRADVKFMKSFAGIKILRVNEAIETTAKMIFVRYNDKDFSFVDCTSFALIDYHRLDHAFAFDNHFRQYRFKRHVAVLPSESR